MEYIEHLNRDEKLRPLIEVHGPVSLRRHPNLCHFLCNSIMSQQLSVKVARVIHNRFLNLFAGQEPVPEQILEISIPEFRSIGLSQAKSQYVLNVARFAVEEGLDYPELSAMENGEFIEYLTRIKGVGRWTAEMALMFALGREDIIALDDLGIQQAMISLYRIRHKDKKKLRNRLTAISNQWSPYRTYACLYLWKWKDNPPV